ncbi:MAG: hypothetical protein JJT89_16425 [Nitriliruptoraceae bacterium]|nr:hypothetical protein [Nitriliruptoraceae bacterium]
MDPMVVPEPVATALGGRPQVGAAEAASTFVTFGEDGFAHLTLLSRAELATHDTMVFVALAGRTTPANLERTGRGTLQVIVGDTAHVCSLSVERQVESGGMRGFACRLVAHRADSLGIPLEPIRYTTPPELPSVERWDLSERVLTELAAGVGVPTTDRSDDSA